MEYKRLGRTGLQVSAIGLGGVPLTMLAPDEALKVIETAIDEGINYFDLDEAGNQFFPEKTYLDSQKKMGVVLKQHRLQCIVGVKSMRTTKEELKKDVDKALEKIFKDTKREVVDIFHLAFVDNEEKLAGVLSPQGGLAALEEARAEGKIDHILVAGHNPAILTKAIKTGRFDVVEFPFNIIEDEYAAELIPLAHEMDIGTIVMKPIGGGQLRTCAEYSLRWILAHDLACVIPGMRNPEEVKRNARWGHTFKPLTPDELRQLQEIAQPIGRQYCHRCGYCMPCSQGILIVGMMDLLRGGLLSEEGREKAYKKIVSIGGSPAGSCIQCGECRKKCPFDLAVPEMMQKISGLYDQQH